MKTILALVVLSMAPAAVAQAPSDVAAAIVCEAPLARNPDVRVVELTGLDTESPESTVRMGLQSAVNDGVSYELSFSDECEGWYAFYFSTSDLVQLKNGSLKTIEGEFEYDDLAEFFPDAPAGTQENQQDKVKITCRLK